MQGHDVGYLSKLPGTNTINCRYNTKSNSPCQWDKQDEATKVQEQDMKVVQPLFGLWVHIIKHRITWNY